MERTQAEEPTQLLQFPVVTEFNLLMTLKCPFDLAVHEERHFIGLFISLQLYAYRTFHYGE